MVIDKDADGDFLDVDDSVRRGIDKVVLRQCGDVLIFTDGTTRLIPLGAQRKREKPEGCEE